MSSNRPAEDSAATDASTLLDSAAIEGRFDGTRLLAPLLTSDVPTLTDQLETAKLLAGSTDASLYITNPVRLPEQISPELHSETGSGADVELLNWAVEQASTPSNQVHGGVYSRRIVTDVLQTISTNDIDTVVLPGTSPRSLLRGEATERIAVHADCDVVVVNGKPGIESVPSVLLPVAGGPHSKLAADLARRIATNSDAWIDVLHVVPENAPVPRREQAETYVETAAQRIARPDTTSTRILEADDPTAAIVDQSRYYPVTVIGAPTKGRLRRLIFGSTNRTIRSDAKSVVLSAWNSDTERSFD